MEHDPSTAVHKYSPAIMYSKHTVPQLLALSIFLVSTAFAFCEANVGLPGAFYACRGAKFSQPCLWYPPNSNCIPFNNMNDVFKSIGPDAGTWCSIYTNTSCRGDALFLWVKTEFVK